MSGPYYQNCLAANLINSFAGCLPISMYTSFLLLPQQNWFQTLTLWCNVTYFVNLRSCIQCVNHSGAIFVRTKIKRKSTFEFKMHLTSKGRTKWRLWFGKTPPQTLLIMSALLWSMCNPDYSSVPCAFVLLLSFFWCHRGKYFLRHGYTQGQNNKHKQGEAKRCWIHFHSTYHHYRGASK